MGNSKPSISYRNCPPPSHFLTPQPSKLKFSQAVFSPLAGSNLHLESRSFSSDCDHCWVSSKLSLLGEKARLRLVKQNQTRRFEVMKKKTTADVLIKFIRKSQGHGIRWHARRRCQGKHGVSALLKCFPDAIDGNDNSGPAILKPKCMQKHAISLLTSQSLMSVRTCTGVGT